MKHTLLMVLAILAASVVLTGCGAVPRSAPVIPPVGWIYTDYTVPVDVHYAGTDLGSKVGTAKTRYLLIPWPIALDFAWGDAAVATAAKPAGISRVKCADIQVLQVLGIYGEMTLRAYGD